MKARVRLKRRRQKIRRYLRALLEPLSRYRMDAETEDALVSWITDVQLSAERKARDDLRKRMAPSR